MVVRGKDFQKKLRVRRQLQILGRFSDFHQGRFVRNRRKDHFIISNRLALRITQVGEFHQSTPFLLKDKPVLKQLLPDLSQTMVSVTTAYGDSNLLRQSLNLQPKRYFTSLGNPQVSEPFMLDGILSQIRRRLNGPLGAGQGRWIVGCQSMPFPFQTGSGYAVLKIFLKCGNHKFETPHDRGRKHIHTHRITIFQKFNECMLTSSVPTGDIGKHRDICASGEFGTGFVSG